MDASFICDRHRRRTASRGQLRTLALERTDQSDAERSRVVAGFSDLFPGVFTPAVAQTLIDAVGTSAYKKSNNTQRAITMASSPHLPLEGEVFSPCWVRSSEKR